MKKLLSCLWLLAMLNFPSAFALEVGQSLESFSGKGGDVVNTLNGLRGQYVYVDFWASWCGPCRLSFPFMNGLHQKYSDQGLEILAINVDAKRTDADKFLSTNPAYFSMAFDGKGDSPRAFAIKAMPTSFLLSPQGKVIFVHQGFRAEDVRGLESQIILAMTSTH